MSSDSRRLASDRSQRGRVWGPTVGAMNAVGRCNSMVDTEKRPLLVKPMKKKKQTKSKKEKKIQPVSATLFGPVRDVGATSPAQSKLRSPPSAAVRRPGVGAGEQLAAESSKVNDRIWYLGSRRAVRRQGKGWGRQTRSGPSKRVGHRSGRRTSARGSAWRWCLWFSSAPSWKQTLDDI